MLSTKFYKIKYIFFFLRLFILKKKIVKYQIVLNNFISLLKL